MSLNSTLVRIRIPQYNRIERLKRYLGFERQCEVTTDDVIAEALASHLAANPDLAEKAGIAEAVQS
jgi:hypothetical protein